MLTLDQALKTLSQHEATLRGLKVAGLSVFGSVARGEASEDSDIDLLVEFSEPVGLFEFAHLSRVLEKILGMKVDLVTPDALRESMRENVQREAVRAA